MPDPTTDPFDHTAEHVRVGLSHRSAIALAAVADRTGYRRVDVINRAIQLYGRIDAQISTGTELLFRYPSGEVERVTIT